jgi:hypothetical protein
MSDASDGKKDGSTKERCVEREERVRIVWAIEEDSTGFAKMVSDWRAGFRLAERDGATIVTADSIVRPNNVLVRTMVPPDREPRAGMIAPKRTVS